MDLRVGGNKNPKVRFHGIGLMVQNVRITDPSSPVGVKLEIDKPKILTE